MTTYSPVAGRELEHRDRLLAIGDEDPGPDLAVAGILGAGVDAAIVGPVERHVAGRRDGDPAALAAPAGRGCGRRSGPGAPRPATPLPGGAASAAARLGRDRKAMIASSSKPAPAPPRILAGLIRSFCSMIPAPPNATSDEDEEQDRRSRAGSRGSPRSRRGCARASRGPCRRPAAAAASRARASSSPRCWSWRSRSAMLTHSVSTARKGWCACAQEGGELAIGDGEGERRVALLVAGDQGVDAEHPAALVEQRPARMAAGDVGGVEQGGDAVDRADVGEDADRAGRRQRRDIILGRAGGGEIDIAGIAQSGDRRAVVERAGVERDRRIERRWSSSSKARSRAGSTATIWARIACAPSRRDDADRDVACPPAPGRRHGRW